MWSCDVPSYNYNWFISTAFIETNPLQTTQQSKAVEQGTTEWWGLHLSYTWRGWCSPASLGGEEGERPCESQTLLTFLMVPLWCGVHQNVRQSSCELRILDHVETREMLTAASLSLFLLACHNIQGLAWLKENEKKKLNPSSHSV